jgi:hypothetical protein
MTEAWIGVVGALCGALPGTIAAVLVARGAAQQETTRIARQLREAEIERVRQAHAFVLNVAFNYRRGGNPDRPTQGQLYAHVQLDVSPSVRAELLPFVHGHSPWQELPVEALVSKMREHVEALARALPRASRQELPRGDRS